MNDNMKKTDDVETPKWDVALALLIRDEYAKKGQPLKIEDFSRLAKMHAIRFDDIMETVFKLCLYNEWCYQETSGTETRITKAMLDELYVNARLDEKDVREYNGGWWPAIV